MIFLNYYMNYYFLNLSGIKKNFNLFLKEMRFKAYNLSFDRRFMASSVFSRVLNAVSLK